MPAHIRGERLRKRLENARVSGQHRLPRDGKACPCRHCPGWDTKVSTSLPPGVTEHLGLRKFTDSSFPNFCTLLPY